MAKKKIKDLTIEETEKICSKYDCRKCPLSLNQYKNCMKNVIYNLNNFKEYLEKEIEVEDGKEEN